MKKQQQQAQQRKTNNGNQNSTIVKQVLQQQLLLTHEGENNDKHKDTRVNSQQSLLLDNLLDENEDSFEDTDNSSRNIAASEFEDISCFYDSSSPSMLVCPDCDCELMKFYNHENYAEWHYFCDNCGIRVSRNSAFAVLLEEDTDNYNNSTILESDIEQTLHWQRCA